MQLQSQFTEMAYPALKSLLDRIKGDLSGGFDKPPASVSTMFDAARTDMNKQYDQALTTSSGLIKQRATQSGGLFSTEQLGDATRTAAIGLEQDRAQAERQLSMQEASAGLGQFNQLMNLLGQGGRTALGMGQGGLGLQLGSIQGLSNTSQMGGAIAGASTGASLGSMGGLGWGTAIGGALGGLYGYFSGG
jgi:hypothetical protein